VTVDFYRPARDPDAEGISVSINPQNADWNYSSLRVLHLRAGQSVTWTTGESEWIVLPLEGSCDVSCGKSQFEIEGRPSVFSRVSDFAYVPRDAQVTVSSEAGGRFALAGAVARRILPARYGAAKDVPVEIRGAGSTSRQVNNFASPDGFETDRLISVEVLTPGGNWSSYPPHKHDHDLDGEAILEEIYYFEVAGGAPKGVPGPGGYQRVYSSGPDHQIDVLAEISSGDCVVIPYGYHGPTMAAPGYDVYFLNVLAGPAPVRTMAVCDDPVHAWIRESWRGEAIDQRLPMTSSEGPV
jgi:5-deoxy-glucuronate isomerase